MRISIIGFGWLGEPLGHYLQQKGFKIKGSTTSSEKAAALKEKGLDTYPLVFNPAPEGEKGPLLDTDLLIITIPPRVRSQKEGQYVKQLSQIKSLAQKAGIPRLIFTSATSVYPDQNQEAFETDPLTPNNTGNTVLLEAENILWNDRSYDLTVIRLGGLLGDDRIPGVYVSDKENIVGHAPVNYIYRGDAVRMIHWIIKNELWNETFNGVTADHPLRKEVYEKNAETLGFPPPASYEIPPLSKWKSVSSSKIQKTGFTFLHHPLSFPYVYP